MKKLFLLLFLGVLSIALVACGSDSTETSNESVTQQEKQGENKENTENQLGIGDTAEVDGIKFTLKNVTTTDERNEFADTDPAMVVKIEYEVENSTDQEIPVGGDLQIYDGTGNQMQSYPLDNTLGSLQPGKKVQGTEHFGINEGPVEIYFQPMMSFGDPAIFSSEVE